MNTNNEVLNTIRSYSIGAADSIRPYLLNADLESYKKFLNAMYHYTLTSGDKLAAVAKKAPTEELKSFFEHMFREERYHFKLAEQDLKGFGLTPKPETPKAVTDFNNFWASLKDNHFNAYLGALYVFENIADKVTEEIKNFLTRIGVNEKQRRGLSIHAEADIEHGQLITNFLNKYLSENVEAAVNGAKEAQKKWSAIMVEAF